MTNFYNIVFVIFIIVNFSSKVFAEEGDNGDECRDTFARCETLVHFCEGPGSGQMEMLCAKTCNLCEKESSESSDPMQPGQESDKSTDEMEQTEGSEENECPSNNKCDHECVMDQGEHVCICRQGYTLDGDNTTCVDINECEEEGVCPNEELSFCENLPGSHRCLPPIGKCRRMEDHINYYDSEECCKLSSETTCGKNYLNGGRDIDGIDYMIKRWPWMGYISRDDEVVCGVTLLSKSWALVAAHCLRGIHNIQEVSVTFGVSETHSIESKTFTRTKINQTVYHPSFSFPRENIALVKLSVEINTNRYITPICLPNNEVVNENKKCFALGYDITFVSGRLTRQLNEVPLTISNTNNCNVFEAGGSPAIICAGNKNAVTDKCQGSTGGPLVCQRCSSCDWFITGVPISGLGCGTANSYTLYTDVTHYERWIDSVTGIKVNGNMGCSNREPLRPLTTIEPPIVETTTDDLIGRRVTEWSDWGEWVACSSSCGGGQQSRERSCISVTRLGCEGEKIEIRSCNEEPCRKSEWLAWEECSEICGGGEQTRRRDCTNDEEDCESETRPCNTGPCIKLHGPWSSWGECSITCGTGRRVSTRSCVIKGCRGDAEKCVTNGCKGKRRRSKSCRGAKCPRWMKWAPWSSCSVTCGGGVSSSSRRCRPPKGACNGESTRTTKCNTEKCPPVDLCTLISDTRDDCVNNELTCYIFPVQCAKTCCKSQLIDLDQTSRTTTIRPSWSTWENWSPCSKTCGTDSTKIRSRKCTLQGAASSACVGESLEQESCKTPLCDPCAHMMNELGDSYCKNLMPYCVEHKAYMSTRCARACCDLNKISEVPDEDCKDHREMSPMCPYFIELCRRSSFVARGCKASCLLC